MTADAWTIGPLGQAGDIDSIAVSLFTNRETAMLSTEIQRTIGSSYLVEDWRWYLGGEL